VVIDGGGPQFPFVYRSSAALGLHAVLSRNVICEETMKRWVVAKL
jgi:hypothetical protein